MTEKLMSGHRLFVEEEVGQDPEVRCLVGDSHVDNQYNQKIL